MKKLIGFIVVLSISLSLFAQAPTELKGGLGVNFGSSRAIVKQMMLTKHPDAKWNSEKKNLLFYDGGKWIGKNVLIWAFVFDASDRVHTIIVETKNYKDDDVFDNYNNIVSDLTSKYGPPKESIENWKYPYEANDKYNFGTTAIAAGKATIMTYWEWDTPDGNNNTILVEILDSLLVKVTYQDGALFDKSHKDDLLIKKDEM